MKPFIHKHNKLVLSVTTLFILLVVAYAYRCGSEGICGPSLITQAFRKTADAVVPTGKIITLEVVDTPQSREQGLSGRTGIHDDEGMLFVFDDPGRYGFWMKDMQFPIDIVWVNDDGLVVNVENEVSPDTYFKEHPPRVFMNGPLARYVIELPSGAAAKDGIYMGTSIKIVK